MRFTMRSSLLWLPLMMIAIVVLLLFLRGTPDEATSDSVAVSGSSLPAPADLPAAPQVSGVHDEPGIARIEVVDVPTEPLAEEPSAAQKQMLGWEKEIVGLSPADIRELAATKAKSMNAAAADELDKRHEAGLYEVTGYGTKWKDSTEEIADMQRTFTLLTMTAAATPPVEHHRTVLPPADFPDLYLMKAHVAWLEEQANAKTPKRQ